MFIIGRRERIFSPHVRMVLPNTLVTNKPIKNITSNVRIIPRPGIFIPSCSRKGDAKSPRNLNKIPSTKEKL